MYITKQQLEKLLNQTQEEHNQYHKPILYVLVFLLTFITLVTVVALLVVISIFTLAYVLVSWIDVLIGKYILKRIFK